MSSVLRKKRRAQPGLADEFLSTDFFPPLCDSWWNTSVGVFHPTRKKRLSLDQYALQVKLFPHTSFLPRLFPGLDSSHRRPLSIATSGRGALQSFSTFLPSRLVFLSVGSPVLYVPRLGQVGYEGHNHPHIHPRSHGDGKGSQE